MANAFFLIKGIIISLSIMSSHLFKVFYRDNYVPFKKCHRSVREVL